MTSKDRVLQRERDRGRMDVYELAKRAGDMTQTEIIAEDSKVPLFVWGTDYSSCPRGTPIAEIVDGEFQVYTMITPVNTSHYPGITPNTERSLFSLCHTTDPKRAKAWVAPFGTSGAYMREEVCTRSGRVWLSEIDHNGHEPGAVGTETVWTDLGAIEDILI